MSWQSAAAAATAIATVCFLIVKGNGYQVFIMVTVGLTAIVGIGLNVLLGLNGQISLGHVAFYAIGAYAVGILTTDVRMAVLAGARRERHCRRIGRRVAGDPGAEGPRALSGHGDDRLRLRGRARRGRVAGFDGRLERLVRHSRPGLFGTDIGEKGIAFLTLALTVLATAAFARLSGSVWGDAMRAVRDSEIRQHLDWS